jgi:hypothetical protein
MLPAQTHQKHPYIHSLAKPNMDHIQPREWQTAFHRGKAIGN